jgi:hypothetical protein
MRLPVWMLIVFAFITATTSATADSVNTLSPADRVNLTATATKLREAILHVDLRTVVSLVSSLRCTDTQYNKAQVRKYLTSTNSILYQSLFDAPRFARRCGADYTRQYPATSERAFFEANPNGSIEIEPVEGGYATVKFTFPKPGYYPREYGFRKEGAKWMLVDGLVVENCSCG